MVVKGLKVEPSNTWLRGPLVYTLMALTGSVCIGGTAFYFRVDSMGAEIAKDRELRTLERAEEAKSREKLIDSIREVRDELKRAVFDSVATKQLQTWIELAKAANKSEYPDIIWPDLPR